MSQFYSRRFWLQQAAKASIAFLAAQVLNSLKPTMAKDLPMETVVGDLKAKIPGWMKQYKIPGLAVAVISDRQIFWNGNFGRQSSRTNTPIDDNSIFAGASLSKPLFAYLVMKLVERGQLDLDTPLIEYTAQPYIKDFRLSLITARHVLSHTTGFPNWSGSIPVWIEATPGTRFGYSGEGFLYLQQAIAEITQQPFASYIQRELLLPLGMNSSSYIWQPAYQNTTVAGHDRHLQSTPMRQPQEGSSAGSLRTTAIEYARFMMAMMQSGTVDSHLLTESSIQEMLRSQVQLNYYLDWGLGWALEYSGGHKYFWHWGDGVIYKTFAIASRELGTGVVILTNSQNGLKICPGIVSAVMLGKRHALDYEAIEY